MVKEQPDVLDRVRMLLIKRAMFGSDGTWTRAVTSRMAASLDTASGCSGTNSRRATTKRSSRSPSRSEKESSSIDKRSRVTSGP